MLAYSLYLDLGGQLKRENGLLGQPKWTRQQRARFWQGLLVTKMPDELRERDGASPFWTAQPMPLDGEESQGNSVMSTRFSEPHHSGEAQEQRIPHPYIVGTSGYTTLMLSCSMTKDFSFGRCCCGCWALQLLTLPCVARRARCAWTRGDVIHCKREETTFASSVTIQVS